MNPPACHPTSAEENQLRILILDSIREAANVGQSCSSFHQFQIYAKRLIQQVHAYDQSCQADMSIELVIMYNRKILCRHIGTLSHD